MRKTRGITTLAAVLALGGFLTLGSLSARADDAKSGDKDQAAQQQKTRKARPGGDHAKAKAKAGDAKKCDGKSSCKAKAGSSHGKRHHGDAKKCDGKSSCKAKGRHGHAKKCDGKSSCKAKASSSRGKHRRGHHGHRGHRHHHRGGHGSHRGA